MSPMMELVGDSSFQRRALELLKLRGSLSAVARELGVPRNTLREHLERKGVDYRTYLPCRNTSPSEMPSASDTKELGRDSAFCVLPRTLSPPLACQLRRRASSSPSSRSRPVPRSAEESCII